jgi:dTDP-4-amino-4,6-dideoxygalactose transaminase
MKKKIKLFDPIIGNAEEVAILKTLRSNFWASGQGVGQVLKFEKNFTRFVNSNDSVAVNSGSSALNLALSLLDLKGKEVILPSLTFVSTAHAIIQNGGKPIYVDVDTRTNNIDPIEIESHITNNTGLIIPVHFGGLPCDLNSILKICKKNNLPLIEDAAHAAGSEYKGKKIGVHGQFVCFSFHPVKNLAMPTGGLITINHKNHKNFKIILKSRRWCGITDRDDANYDVKDIGWNYYMNEFSAAIGNVQLKKLEKLNKIRKKTARIYSQEIKLDSIMPFDHNCSYHFFWICVKSRKKFRKFMSDHGIETGTHYKPIHKMTFFDKKIHLKNTEQVSNEIVTIPTHPNLSEDDISYIIKKINLFNA